jgi:hypothetical protein
MGRDFESERLGEAKNCPFRADVVGAIGQTPTATFDAVVTIAPALRSSMNGGTVRVTSIVPVRLISIVSRQCASGMSLIRL